VATLVVSSEQQVHFEFDRRHKPVAHVVPGDQVEVETTDRFYQTLEGSEIDRGRVAFGRANALTGPLWIDGAEPGDAVGLTVAKIELGRVTHVVYTARWRAGTFGVPESRVVRLEIAEGQIRLPNGGTIAHRPMIGCIGTAPALHVLSSLSPCGSTGGNLDLVELEPGVTIWLPCQVAGALLSLGDLHARMGRGEPVGAGLECAGRVYGTIRLAKEARLSGPVVVSKGRISFVGSHDSDRWDAERVAVGAAWRWLLAQIGGALDDAFAIAAGLLGVDCGGPAGANVVASFGLDDLVAAGVQLSGPWLVPA
jgi:amidase